MKKVRFFSFLACAVALCVLGVYCVLPSEADPQGERPTQWAERVQLDGAPNLHRVTWNIYRSAQPTSRGFKNLEKLGIKTVVNLRAFHGDRLTGTSLRGIRIKMNAWHPEEEDVVQAMRVLLDESGEPYLVHCQHGADRTGMIIAAYRVVVQDWRREDAVDEMVNGGYGYHLIWGDILRYLERLDVEKIRRLIGKDVVYLGRPLYPLPMNGIVLDVMVKKGTLASKGSPAKAAVSFSGSSRRPASVTVKPFCNKANAT